MRMVPGFARLGRNSLLGRSSTGPAYTRPQEGGYVAGCPPLPAMSAPSAACWRLRFASFVSIPPTPTPRTSAGRQFSRPKAANPAHPAGSGREAMLRIVLANSRRVR